MMYRGSHVDQLLVQGVVCKLSISVQGGWVFFLCVCNDNDDDDDAMTQISCGLKFNHLSLNSPA